MEIQIQTLAVYVLAYNHEKFIRQCLDSILMQQTSFPLHIYVHEDCSTDSTAAIIREYVSRYPDIVHADFHERNLYSIGQLSRYITETPLPYLYRYFTIIEGDDYLTDPHKFQRQIDFLDSHPDYALCCHSVELLCEATGEMRSSRMDGVPDDFDAEEVIVNGLRDIHTVSTVYRSTAHNTVAARYCSPIVIDYHNKLLALMKGGRGYRFPESMAVYRTDVGVRSKEKRLQYEVNTVETSIIYSMIPFAVDTPYLPLMQERVQYLIQEQRERMEEKDMHIDYLQSEVQRLTSLLKMYEDSRILKIGRAIRRLRHSE